MAAPERVVLLKSWSTRDDAAVIKEVATKGEYVDLCMAYLARKKKIPIEESRKYFHQVVDSYVARLLNDKLVFKAENVLQNVSRDWKSIYYQYAFDLKEGVLKFLILDHIKKKNPENFDEEVQEYEFFWNILREVQKCPALNSIVQTEMESCNLDGLYQKDESYRKTLIVRLYFETRDPKLCIEIEKVELWDYLVNEKLYSELAKWCYLSQTPAENEDNIENTFGINDLYKKWKISHEMFQTASDLLEDAPEILKNSFTAQGFVFVDERGDIRKNLQRLFTTETLTEDTLKSKHNPYSKFLIENEAYSCLLEYEHCTAESLETLKSEYPEKSNQLDLIATLKNESVDNKESFSHICDSIEKCLEDVKTADCEENLAMIKLSQCLIYEENLNCLYHLKYIDVHSLRYIQSLMKRLRKSCRRFELADIVKTTKPFDFSELEKCGSREIISFSNKLLSSKYSQRLKTTYIYYLKQHRSSYAVYYFFFKQLTGYSQISKSQMHNAAEIVMELAVLNFTNEELVIHCIAFVEMLGFDSQYLRSFLQLLRISLSNEPQRQECVAWKYHELIKIAEEKIFKNPTSEITDFSEFPLRQYQAVMQVAQTFESKTWPDLYLKELCISDDWYKYLILVQYFEIPLWLVKNNSKIFKSSTVGEHMLRALLYDPIPEKPKRKSSVSRQKSRGKGDGMHTSGETMTSSVSSSSEANPLLKSTTHAKFLLDNEDLDIFAITLLSSNNFPEDKINSYQKFVEIIQDSNSYSTSINLMKNAIKYDQPNLLLLAVITSDLNLQWYWTVWLAVSTVGIEMVFSYRDFDEMFWNLIEASVKMSCVETLHKSFQLFYKESKFNYLTNFLQQTRNLKFSSKVIEELRLYLLAWSNDEVHLPISVFDKELLLQFTVKLLILHLKFNFNSTNYQQMFLDSICQSGISDVNLNLDFCLLRKIFRIISSSGIDFDFEQLISDMKDDKFPQNGLENFLVSLQESQQYHKAIELYNILNIPVGDIVYSKWINGISDCWPNKFNFAEYESETKEYSLAPEILINFYLHVASLYAEPSGQKYLMMKKALDVIKTNHLFPNECFDRDNIEYEMILCFLKSDQSIDELDIYHSEYFEQILSLERCVLYKSFPELKELAGIEELAILPRTSLSEGMKLKLASLLNRLLDEGDIVEALRLQAIFEYRTLDLHFIVFCMALAEGLTSLSNLSSDERQLLASVEISSVTRFNKRTLGRVKLTQASNASPVNLNETSDSWSTLDFEEIPPREKQDILEAIQGLASRLKHGINIGKRIVMVYRASMYLDKDYLDVLRMKDSTFLLKNVRGDDCLQKLLVISDIMTSTQMSHTEIAEFLSYEIVTAIIKPRFYTFRADQPNINLHLPIKNNLWGYDLDKEFHLFLELCPNTTLLGNVFLDYCDALRIYRKYQDNKNIEMDIKENPQILNAFQNLKEIIQICGFPLSSQSTSQVISHKKQNTIYVELLIKSHECFVHECCMEGIANVLTRSKSLNTILGTAKSWNLIVRMLIGIGQYREMYFCFDTLIKSEQFESLLGQFDEDKTNGLRHAIIWYIREYCPQNKEYVKLAALHFLMFKELAEMWENETNSMIAKIISENQKSYDENSLNSVITSPTAIAATSPSALAGTQTSSSKNNNSDDRNLCITAITCSSEIINQLNDVLNNYTHATENYLLDNKLRLAERSASNAEMVALQIDLMNKAITASLQNCICVLSIRSHDEFKELINKYLSVPQAMILGHAYPYEINWPDAILSQYIILERSNYIIEFTERMDLTDGMIETIVKNFQSFTNITQKMEEHMANIVRMVNSVDIKYKLASVLGFKDILTTLINDQSLHYLKDISYGRYNFDLSGG